MEAAASGALPGFSQPQSSWETDDDPFFAIMPESASEETAIRALETAQSELVSIDKREDALLDLYRFYKRFAQWENAEIAFVYALKLRCTQRSDMVFQSISRLKSFYIWKSQSNSLSKSPSKFSEVTAALKPLITDTALSTEFRWKVYEEAARLCCINNSDQLLSAVPGEKVSKLEPVEFARWVEIQYKLYSQFSSTVSAGILYTVLKHILKIDPHSQSAKYLLTMLKSTPNVLFTTGQKKIDLYRSRAIALICSLSDPIIIEVLTAMESYQAWRDAAKLLSCAILLIEDRANSRAYLSLSDSYMLMKEPKTAINYGLQMRALLYKKQWEIDITSKVVHTVVEMKQKAREFAAVEVLSVYSKKSRKYDTLSDSILKARAIRGLYYS